MAEIQKEEERNYMCDVRRLEVRRLLEESVAKHFDPMNLWSEGLFSKYGFWDGDQLFDWKERHLLPGKELLGVSLLVAAVKAYLLPALRQKVVVEVVDTVHNPIRAISVDGIPVDWEWENETQGETFWLEPRMVRVTDQQLAALFPNLLSVEPTHYRDYETFEYKLVTASEVAKEKG